MTRTIEALVADLKDLDIRMREMTGPAAAQAIRDYNEMSNELDRITDGNGGFYLGQWS